MDSVPESDAPVPYPYKTLPPTYEANYLRHPGKPGRAGLINWADLLYEIAESFGGQMPHPATAQDIEAAYTRSPQTVLRTIDQVTAAYQDGTARQPWGLLRHRVKDIPADQAKAERRVDRDKQIERVEQWIRNVGHELDWREIEDELWPQPEWTPPLDWLEQLEVDTRGTVGRPAYDSLLLAAIERTREHGVELVPERPGRLRETDSPELRARLRDLHATVNA